MNPSSSLGHSGPLLQPPASSGGPCPAAGGLGGSEMELQKMLIDERMRCENHKQNYETLKADHTRLQTEITRAQGEVKRLMSDRQVDKERMQLLLAELRGDLLDRTRELEELRLQVMTPQRLELLRAQVQQEMEGPVRERFNKLEEESEKYRSEYNKLRYDYTFLKSQFDHHREESERILEERRIRFEAEIGRLERDKEDLLSHHRGSDPSRDEKRVEALLREKAQLHLRLKGLEVEVQELRAQRDDSGQQAENVQRIQIRQLAESQSAVKAMEAERQSLRLQLERMEKEMQHSHEQNTTLTARLHKAEREVNSLSCQVESMKHTHKLEVSNVKLECSRSKGELERERDALRMQVDGLESDMEVLQGAVERQKEVLADKEREMVRRVQAAREDEFHKTAVLHEEKLDLENRLAELEQQRAMQSAADHAHKEEWEERLRSAQLGEESARKEVQSLKTKIQQHVSHLEELERQKADLSDLRQQNQELGMRLGTLSHSESALAEVNQRLRETLDRVREDLRSARGQSEKSQHEAERLVEERRVQWLEEKHQLQQREAELEEKYRKAKEKYIKAIEKLQRAAQAQKKRKALTENREKRLQEKIQLLEAKVVEVELEADAAKRRPSFSEEHTHLSRRLKELQRRHTEFRRLLLGNQIPAGSGPDFMTASTGPLLIPGSEEEQHQRELALVRGRLEELEAAQQQQLEEMEALMQKDRDAAGTT